MVEYRLALVVLLLLLNFRWVNASGCLLGSRSSSNIRREWRLYRASSVTKQSVLRVARMSLSSKARSLKPPMNIRCSNQGPGFLLSWPVKSFRHFITFWVIRSQWSSLWILDLDRFFCPFLGPKTWRNRLKPSIGCPFRKPTEPKISLYLLENIVPDRTIVVLCGMSLYILKVGFVVFLTA